MRKLSVDVKHDKYDILLDHGLIHQLSKYIDVNQKIFILTDKGVPKKWVDIVSKQCVNSMVYTVEGGETSKSMETFKEVLVACKDFGMTRKDLLIALGGGVIGDLGGFVAASYMRGISFISIPTTTLSQIDSSIGGKVAINLDHTKNIVGAFYHPKKVLIDFDVLETLERRHVLNGLVEAIKAGLIHDESIFELFEKENWEENIEEIIYRSLLMKKKVVEEDEKESGLRKTLNFGHTIGHGFESYHFTHYFHGECVAMGMLYFIEDDVLKERVINVFKKMNIPYTCDYDAKQVYEYICNDKKAHDDKISVVKVKTIGKSYVEDMDKKDILTLLEVSA